MDGSSSEEIHRRMSDFPDDAHAKEIGAWRTLSVQRTLSSASWLLVGRRHSVDDRREAIERGKDLFLGVLQQAVEGSWRERVIIQTKDLKSLHEQLVSGMEAQVATMEAARRWWAERHAADVGYLARLTECGAPPSPEVAHEESFETDWIAKVRKVCERSEALSAQFPKLTASHSAAIANIHRVVERVADDVAKAQSAEGASQRTVWPQAHSLAVQLPGTHTPDFGPTGPCTWLAVRRYITACDALEGALIAGLAQLRRAERRLAHLGDWVSTVLARGCHESVGATPSASDLMLEHDTPGRSGEQHEEDALGTTIDLEPLEELKMTLEACGEGLAEGDWVPVQALISVDHWLHIWSPIGLSKHSAPTLSVNLTQECGRPVAVRDDPQEPQQLRLALRPAPVQVMGFAARLGVLLSFSRGSPDVGGAGNSPKVHELRLRCQDPEETEELLTSFETIERLYPMTS